MIHISVIESDKEIASKFLKTAISITLTMSAIIYFLQDQKDINNAVFALPVAAFLFCLGISLYYKKRGGFSSILVDDEKLIYANNNENKTIHFSDIQKITADKYWGAEHSGFEFYLCTDTERFRVPRLDTVTDIKIIKTIIKIKPDIDAAEVKKIVML